MLEFSSFTAFYQTWDRERIVSSDLAAKHTTATPSASFYLFPQLPTELRYKIWRHSIPSRVLQMGTDIPYPFLRIPKPATTQSGSFIDSDTTVSPLYPIPVSQPALLSACHGSRAVCLEEYIPLGYSYIHPIHDTLYVSRLANNELKTNLGSIHGGSRPPLYPIALLDRVAMELDESDLPPKHTWHTGGTASLLRNMLVTFCSRQTRRSYIGLELTDIDSDVRGAPDGNLAEVVDFVKKRLPSRRSPWMERRVPEIKCVGMKVLAIVATPYSSLKKLLPAGDRIAEEWRREVFELNGMDWNWGVHGNPYYPENMERALSNYRESLKVEPSCSSLLTEEP